MDISYKDDPDVTFIQSLVINGFDVNVYSSDAGQCYFFEYDKDGKHFIESCGTYNSEYAEYIYYSLDPVFKEIKRKDLYGEDLNKEEINKLKSYNDLFISIQDGAVK